MPDLIINTDTCIHCGECVADCLAGVLELRDGVPATVPGREGKCIQCQHCLAVCPTGAFGIFGLDPEESLPLAGNFPEPEKMEILMKGRRSVRRYREAPVDPALIARILETVRHAPTAVNCRSTLLTVVDDKAVMDKLRDRAMNVVADILQNNALPQGWERLRGYLEPCLSGTDTIFRGAPHLLIASAPRTSPSPQADGFIALTYFELLAASHGLGTVWDGIARAVITMLSPDLGQALGIPEDHEVVHMLAFGQPAVKYHRTVQRLGGKIHRATLS